MRAFRSIVFVGLVLLASCKKEPSATPVTTKCKADSDCVWAFKTRGECCVNPCGGGTPVHVDENAAITEYNAWYCTAERQKQCPQAGACANPPAGPGALTCNAGACVAITLDAGTK